jgi:hypothetical protein
MREEGYVACMTGLGNEYRMSVQYHESKKTASGILVQIEE